MKSAKLVTILLILTISAGVVVTYIKFSPTKQPVRVSTAVAKPEILKYVPQDTITFFGGLKPAPFQEMLKVFTSKQNWMQDFEKFDPLQAQAHNAKQPDALKLIMSLQTQYAKALANSSTIGAVLGTGKTLEGAFYMVGAFPVFRVKLTDENAFQTFVKKAETAVNIHPGEINLDKQVVKTYSLDQPDAKSPSGADAILAVIDNYAIFTIATKLNREENLRLALGLKTPSPSLADSNYLIELQQKYHFNPEFLGYINHREIIKGLTNANSNSFGRMLEAFIQKSMTNKRRTTNSQRNTPPHPLAAIQTPDCQKELMEYADIWPRSVFGYTKMDLTKQPVEITARAVIEINDNQLISGLKTLTGFIPESLLHVNNDTLLGLGIGLNVDAFMPFVNGVFSRLTQAKYLCKPLQNFQQKLIASGGPAKLGMFAGMLSGLQGVSLSIFDVDGNVGAPGTRPQVNSIDALLSISSKTPQSLIAAASSMAPNLANIQIPADGTPVDFPVPLPVKNGGNAKIAMNDKHIVIYTGEKSLKYADILKNEALQQTGWLGFDMDFSTFEELILSKLPQVNKNRPLTQEQKDAIARTQKIIKAMKMKMNEVTNVTDNGIVIDMNESMY